MRALWRFNQRINQWRAMRAITEALRVAYPFILVMALLDFLGQGWLTKTGFFIKFIMSSSGCLPWICGNS